MGMGSGNEDGPHSKTKNLLVMGRTKFEVRYSKPKIGCSSFDYQKMNRFKCVGCSKNDVCVCLFDE